MIDRTNESRTRDGHEARIYATDGGGSHPVHGAYFDGEQWHNTAWRSNGSIRIDGGTHRLDLIEVKPRIRRELWANVYDDDAVVVAHPSKELADRRALSDRPRKACVRVAINCEEGEGL